MTDIKEGKEITALFHQYFEGAPLLAKSPGRINIIGEHTDYNDGFVMPAAIDKAAYVGITLNSSDKCKLVAHDLDETYEFDLKEELKPTEVGWANYFIGVLDGFKKKGVELAGFNMVFTSNVPLGAGLSSSAALESSFGFALNELFEVGFTLVELAQIGQMAEHNFAGVKCGIMDQYASCLGQENHAILLDCRSLEHTLIDLDIEGYELVLFNTKVKHNLGDSEYNVRRAQCEEGVAKIQGVYAEVKSLRDVTIDRLIEFKDQLDTIVYKRCEYVVQEKDRVMAAVDAMKKGDIVELGQLMYQTHDGLSNNYEVSCKELDLLVDFAHKSDNIIGARMMGGGFGGCTLNLVKSDKVQETIEEIISKYEDTTQTTPEYYLVKVSDGAKRIY
ncbi:MAG: galactokinase [Reichenbachiella sp.]